MAIKKHLITLLFLSLCVPSIAFSAPAISGITGAWEDGNSIVITGSDFGSGPSVLFFDNYEGGVNGEDIETGVGSATFGQYVSTSGTDGNPYYTNSASVSGSLAQQSNMQGIPNGGFAWSQVDLPADTTDIFICWWLYLPTEDNAPGEGDAVNWKQIWIQGADTGDDDLVVPTILGSSTWNSRQYYINANDNPYANYISLNFQKGTWKRLWVWVKGGYSSDGQVYLWELDGEVKTRSNDDNVTNLYSGGIFEKVRINGYGRVTNNCHPTFDDVYIATGANAQARVEMGDNAIYTSCNNLSICTPTAWATDEITFTMHYGSFGDTDTVYLFVVDSDGDASSGYELTFGSTTCAVTGTITSNVLESAIINGGETIILTLTGDTWESDIGTDCQHTTDLIAGIDSAKAEAAGWDAEVKGVLTYSEVVRTSATVVTITLHATNHAAYDITESEIITVTVPASCLVTGEDAVVASPTFTVGYEATNEVSLSVGYNVSGPSVGYATGGISVGP